MVLPLLAIAPVGLCIFWWEDYCLRMRGAFPDHEEFEYFIQRLKFLARVCVKEGVDFCIFVQVLAEQIFSCSVNMPAFKNSAFSL